MKSPKIVEVGLYIFSIWTRFLFAKRFYLIFLNHDIMLQSHTKVMHWACWSQFKLFGGKITQF